MREMQSWQVNHLKEVRQQADRDRQRETNRHRQTDREKYTKGLVLVSVVLLRVRNFGRLSDSYSSSSFYLCLLFPFAFAFSPEFRGFHVCW
jgi:hypothetical protein